MGGEVVAGAELGLRSPVVDLLEAEALRPHAALLRWQEGEWTVAMFADRARRCATRLEQMGVGPGDRVGILSTNSAYQLAWQYGVYMIGAVEVAINSELRGPMLAHIVQDSEPLILLVQDQFCEVLSRLEMPVPPMQEMDSPAAIERIEGTEPFSGPCHPSPDALASILYSSGTTGPSKGVMLPHGAFSNLAEIFASVLRLGATDVGYFTMPFFHVDFHIVLPACLQTGAVVAFRKRFSASSFWDDVRTFDVTWWFAIGALLSAMMTRDVPADLRGLRLNRIIGAPVPPAAYEFFEERLGIPIQSTYGQTEADAPLFETATERRRGSAGRAIAGFQVAIVNELGEEVAPGVVGELVYRPLHPNLMATGYWRRPEATQDAFRGLWFHSGDLAAMDGDGFVFYRGRITESLRRRGENISAYELEETLRLANGVHDAAAISVSDELGGEDDIKVFLELKVPNSGFDVGAFFAFCEGNLPRFAIPRYVEVMPDGSFPRSVGSGSVQKHLLSRSIGPHTFDRLLPTADGT